MKSTSVKQKSYVFFFSDKHSILNNCIYCISEEKEEGKYSSIQRFLIPKSETISKIRDIRTYLEQITTTFVTDWDRVFYYNAPNEILTQEETEILDLLIYHNSKFRLIGKPPVPQKMDFSKYLLIEN